MWPRSIINPRRRKEMSSIEFLGAELHARRSNIGIMGLGKEGKIKKKKKKKFLVIC